VRPEVAHRVEAEAAEGAEAPLHRSVELAARDYGVVITTDLVLDREATARIRATA
jgi:hypothetical protein